MNARSPISRALRFQILRRDNHACRYCGATAPEAVLVVDHVTPVALGGQTVPENLAAACQDCNQGKASMPPDASQVADVQADAVRWSRAMRAAAAIQLQQLEVRERYVAAIDEEWSSWTYGSQKWPLPRPEDWSDAVGRWFDLGLEVELAVDLVGVAMRRQRVGAKDTWRYFCGACWKTLRDRAEVAQGLLDAEETED